MVENWRFTNIAAESSESSVIREKNLTQRAYNQPTITAGQELTSKSAWPARQTVNLEVAFNGLRHGVGVSLAFGSFPPPSDLFCSSA
jgi:hypothetical protein